MKFQLTQHGYILVLVPGEEVITSLTHFAEQQNIRSGSIMGIGAVENTTLAYYDLDQKKYLPKEFPDRMELVSLQGNYAYLNGKPFAHCHIVISGRDFVAYSGHLMRATISATGEIYISVTSNEIVRGPDAYTGLNLIKL
ncbi:MAG: DNA-binding protein [Acidobacteriia bacterium]|nr:DNA-binding protein [Terriglobia bacterium]